ncbi:hypothetical protein LINPERHAP1_LOCUS93 [Linum perenne]
MHYIHIDHMITTMCLYMPHLYKGLHMHENVSKTSESDNMDLWPK